MTNLIGLEPASAAGVMFHRSTWGWQPLWEYCDSSHADITDCVDYPYAEQSDGLDAPLSFELAERLDDDLRSGAASNYVFARNVIVASLPDALCSACGGTGVRDDEVGTDTGMVSMMLKADQAVRLKRSRGWCDRCFGEGRILAFEKAYELNVRDISDFSRFLRHCGGFVISDV